MCVLLILRALTVAAEGCMYIGTVLRKEIRDPCFVGVFVFGARLKCTYCLTFAYPSALQHVRHCADNLCEFLLCHYSDPKCKPDSKLQQL